MREFNRQINSKLFDISTKDTTRIKTLEKYHGVKMGEVERDFLEDQKTERTGYCDGFIDRKWRKTMARRQEEAARIEKQQQEAAAEQERYEKTVSSSEIEMETNEELDDKPEEGTEYHPETPSYSGKRQKRSYVETPKPVDDDMPHKWAHIRCSERKVKSEFYVTVDKLISVYHCSKRQAVAAVVTVANNMFGRQWKEHDQDENTIDPDTTPD